MGPLSSDVRVVVVAGVGPGPSALLGAGAAAPAPAAGAAVASVPALPALEKGRAPPRRPQQTSEQGEMVMTQRC
jgi:hypothetical protein